MERSVYSIVCLFCQFSVLLNSQNGFYKPNWIVNVSLDHTQDHVQGTASVATAVVPAG